MMAGSSEGEVENETTAPESNPDAKPAKNVKIKLVCKMVQDVLLIVSILYSAVGLILNSNVTKLRGPNSPKPFFQKQSLVRDYWRGDVFKAFQDSTLFENSFFMYYAAWDADCQAARTTMEEVARFFSDTDILVATVNCWYPTGDCSKQFNTKGHTHPYPVFIFYPRELKGVQYRGPVTAEYIIAFVRNCRYPLTHLRDLDHFHQLLTVHSSVLVGYTPTTTPTSLDVNHAALHQASLSLHEYDPHRELTVAAVTSPHLARHLHLHLSLPVRLFTWNSTHVFPNKTVDSDKLITWAINNDSRPVSWLNLPGRKSLVLNHSLSGGPALLVFTPRNPLLADPVYRAVRSLAAAYHDCNKSNIVKETVDRLDQLETHQECGGGLTECLMKSWSYDSPTESVCRLRPAGNVSCDSRTEARDPREGLHFDENVDILLDEEVRESDYIRDNMKRSRFVMIGDTNVNINELGCESNRTLTVHTVDSSLYSSLLGGMGLQNRPLPLSVIVSTKQESLFLPQDSSSLGFRDKLSNLMSSWHEDNLAASPGYRSSHINTHHTTHDSHITEVNSATFLSTVSQPGVDTVLFYTSSFCVHCTAASHVLHSVAEYFAQLDTVKFVMVDATKNDLPWQFTTLSYPAVIVFPRNRPDSSRVFSSHKALSVVNLLTFVASNVTPEARLWLALKHCDQACIAKTRVTATKTITDLLSMARRRPSQGARRRIDRRLKFTRTLLHVLERWEADKTKTPQVSRKYFRAILDSFTQRI